MLQCVVMTRCVSAIGVTLAVVLAGPVGRPQPKPSEPAAKLSQASILPATVPYDLRHGLLLVPVAVGTAATEPAALDTGLPTSVMAAELAQTIRLAGGPITEVRCPMGALKLASAPAQLVRIAGMVLTDVPFCVGDVVGQLSARSLEDAPRLWLGASALAGLSVTIDPGSRDVTFRAAGAPLPNRAPTAPIRAVGPHIVVDVRVNEGRPFAAIVDTGSAGTLIPAATARELKLAPSVTVPIRRADGKDARACLVRLRELRVGAVTLKDAAAYYLDGVPEEEAATAVLGTDLLLRHRVTIDRQRKRIAFEKVEAPSSPPSSVGGGETP